MFFGGTGLLITMSNIAIEVEYSASESALDQALLEQGYSCNEDGSVELYGQALEDGAVCFFNTEVNLPSFDIDQDSERWRKLTDLCTTYNLPHPTGTDQIAELVYDVTVHRESRKYMYNRDLLAIMQEADDETAGRYLSSASFSGGFDTDTTIEHPKNDPVAVTGALHTDEKRSLVFRSLLGESRSARILNGIAQSSEEVFPELGNKTMQQYMEEHADQGEYAVAMGCTEILLARAQEKVQKELAVQQKAEELKEKGIEVAEMTQETRETMIVQSAFVVAELSQHGHQEFAVKAKTETAMSTKRMGWSRLTDPDLEQDDVVTQYNMEATARIAETLKELWMQKPSIERKHIMEGLLALHGVENVQDTLTQLEDLQQTPAWEINLDELSHEVRAGILATCLLDRVERSKNALLQQEETAPSADPDETDTILALEQQLNDKGLYFSTLNPGHGYMHPSLHINEETRQVDVTVCPDVEIEPDVELAESYVSLTEMREILLNPQIAEEYDMLPVYDDTSAIMGWYGEPFPAEEPQAEALTPPEASVPAATGYIAPELQPLIVTVPEHAPTAEPEAVAVSAPVNLTQKQAPPYESPQERTEPQETVRVIVISLDDDVVQAVPDKPPSPLLQPEQEVVTSPVQPQPNRSTPPLEQSLPLQEIEHAPLPLDIIIIPEPTQEQVQIIRPAPVERRVIGDVHTEDKMPQQPERPISTEQIIVASQQGAEAQVLVPLPPVDITPLFVREGVKLVLSDVAVRANNSEVVFIENVVDTGTQVDNSVETVTAVGLTVRASEVAREQRVEHSVTATSITTEQADEDEQAVEEHTETAKYAEPEQVEAARSEAATSTTVEVGAIFEEVNEIARSEGKSHNMTQPERRNKETAHEEGTSVTSETSHTGEQKKEAHQGSKEKISSVQEIISRNVTEQIDYSESVQVRKYTAEEYEALQNKQHATEDVVQLGTPPVYSQKRTEQHVYVADSESGTNERVQRDQQYKTHVSALHQADKHTRTPVTAVADAQNSTVHNQKSQPDVSHTSGLISTLSPVRFRRPVQRTPSRRTSTHAMALEYSPGVIVGAQRLRDSLTRTCMELGKPCKVLVAQAGRIAETAECDEAALEAFVKVAHPSFSRSVYVSWKKLRGEDGRLSREPHLVIATSEKLRDARKKTAGLRSITQSSEGVWIV